MTNLHPGASNLLCHSRAGSSFLCHSRAESAQRRIPAPLSFLFCHSRAQRRIPVFSYDSALKSRHEGFSASMSAIFLCRNRPLICFSAAIAAAMSSVS